MESLRKTRCFKAEELKEYCKREPSVWKLIFIARPTLLLEQHPKQREILPKKKLYKVAPSPLCISQSWRDISLKLRSTLRGNTYTLSCPPGRTGTMPPSSSTLLHVKDFGDPQKFSIELLLNSVNPVKPKLFIQILSPWFLTWWGKFSEILDSNTHTNIFFWVSVCISATFWLTALHY